MPVSVVSGGIDVWVGFLENILVVGLIGLVWRRGNGLAPSSTSLGIVREFPQDLDKIDEIGSELSDALRDDGREESLIFEF